MVIFNSYVSLPEGTCRVESWKRGSPKSLPSCFPASSMATLNPLAHARASQIVLQLAGAPQLGAWGRERVPKSQPDKP